MGARHGPAEGVTGDRTALRVMLGVLVPLLVASVVGLVAVWPSGASFEGDERGGIVDLSGTEQVPGEVLAATADLCEGAPDEREPDGSIPLDSLCAEALVRVLQGPEAGDVVTVPLPPQLVQAGIGPGERVVLGRNLPTTVEGTEVEADTGQVVYSFVDFDRAQPLLLLAGLFAVLVVAIGRLRGAAAIAGLALTYAAIAYVVLPALREGEDPVLVALSVAVPLMTAVLYLAHGLSTRTTAALSGTVFGLLATTGLAVWATRAADLTGLTSEDAYVLSTATTGADLRGIVLCGLVVAGLGILNDVTITQVSAVWEIRALAPTAGFRELFRGGMRVGRDHLASTVYTIAFAYAGAALPTLLLLGLYGQPLEQVVTSGAVAEEIARTAVGSIGMILAIPVTTAVAAVSVGRAAPLTAR
ncbi:YibE/F family protein [Aquipuribacter nitratireducens]|uniref:YibE/F family protein n=1 Tax=Aquipuribacter nitratireducens TaxID=650104 RepID=A0ABW0GTM2_9MICO